MRLHQLSRKKSRFIIRSASTGTPTFLAATEALRRRQGDARKAPLSYQGPLEWRNALSPTSHSHSQGEPDVWNRLPQSSAGK
ncbi:hypothetical protein EYF80_037125 [Liparis tanakae]|uniref:Uncharacterized protein n=1 Tax=Liparis tanakae TaxID=230148 RepID=A0A4Z2GIR3_9TELE|nr:hypothetical protein EYF80_037125 [Liparis tanakae]